jgi:hypothetical protein
LLEKWRATKEELARDHALLSACSSDSEVFGCETARQLRDIIEDAKAQQGLAVIGHINRAINFAIKPASYVRLIAAEIEAEKAATSSEEITS